ncbi:MAG: Cof-type HAD-IIB family hydrolase [Bacillota bacterium]|nr:Cof-type HAD-IIB family hydrolase [Bacillota bacterium]
MKYKMLCIDMDGTLLNSQKEITEKNKEYLRKAQEAGVKVVITTGRLFTSADYYADLIGIKAPIISANGAYIREKDRDEVIYKALLGRENCCTILEVLKKYELIPNFHTPNKIFTERKNPHIQMYLKINDRHPEDKKIDIIFVDKWEHVFEEFEMEILKCLAISEDNERVMKAKGELLTLEGLEVVSSSSNNFEVMTRGISKGRAVEILASYYNIVQDEIICIGDNENDASMIQYAGLGVAMGNAEEEIKDMAQYITASNDEDGVAEVVDKFILGYTI